MTQTATATPALDPVTDVARLLEVARYDLTSPRLRAVLHAFASEAAERLELPVGLVTIVLDGAQFLAGSHGLEGTWMEEAGGTPVEWAFCATAVRTGQPYVVENAAVDPVQFDNPLVVTDGIRSYAGAPLITPSGHVLGTCCTLSFEPHDFTPDELAVLEGLSARIIAELEHYAVERRGAPRT